MSEETYNGWTNYETWGAALILNNEPALQDQARDVVHRVCDDVRGGEMYPYVRLQEGFEDLIRDLCGSNESLPPMASQLLYGALSRVNYRELAETFADDWDDGAIAAHRRGLLSRHAEMQATGDH